MIDLSVNLFYGIVKSIKTNDSIMPQVYLTSKMWKRKLLTPILYQLATELAKHFVIFLIRRII